MLLIPFMKRFWTRLVALVLVAMIGLTGCGGAITLSDSMSGDYAQDAAMVIQKLRTTINLAEGTEEQFVAQAEARNLINDFASRYRRDKAVSGTASFTSLQTALNSLAGYYNISPNGSIPQDLKDRLERAFKLTELALKRGS
jgi:photosystem II Psb27 protein